MTNFDYISEQIIAHKMNAEQMEDFIFNGVLEEFDCVCTDCRKKFLGLRYVPLIKPCPFCGCGATTVTQNFYCRKFYVECENCNARSGLCETESSAVESWNSIRREQENE